MWLKLNELNVILVEKIMALLMICFSKSIITSTRRQQRVAPSQMKSGPAIFDSDKTSSWHENKRAKYISKPESIEITMCNPLTKTVCLFLDATLQLFDTLNLNRHHQNDMKQKGLIRTNARTEFYTCVRSYFVEATKYIISKFFLED